MKLNTIREDGKLIQLYEPCHVGDSGLGVMPEKIGIMRLKSHMMAIHIAHPYYGYPHIVNDLLGRLFRQLQKRLATHEGTRYPVDYSKDT